MISSGTEKLESRVEIKNREMLDISIVKRVLINIKIEGGNLGFDITSSFFGLCKYLNLKTEVCLAIKINKMNQAKVTIGFKRDIEKQANEMMKIVCNLFEREF